MGRRRKTATAALPALSDDSDFEPAPRVRRPRVTPQAGDAGSSNAVENSPSAPAASTKRRGRASKGDGRPAKRARKGDSGEDAGPAVSMDAAVATESPTVGEVPAEAHTERVEDESDDDIVWEVVQGARDEPATHEAPPLTKTPTENIRISVEIKSEKERARERTAREEELREIGRQRREAFASVHMAHLVCLIATLLSINRALKDRTLRARLSSRLSLEDAKRRLGNADADVLVRAAIEAVRGAANVDDTLKAGVWAAGDRESDAATAVVGATTKADKGKGKEDEGTASDVSHPLVAVLCEDIARGTTSHERFVFLSVAAARELGLRARLVLSPRVSPLRPPGSVRAEMGGTEEDGEEEDADARAFREMLAGLAGEADDGGSQPKTGEIDAGSQARDAKGKARARRRSKPADSGVVAETIEGVEAAPKSEDPWASAWMEVLCESDGHARWLPVAMPAGEMDNAAACVAGAVRPISHVLAVDGDGCVRDVTRRYVPEPSRVRRFRMSDVGAKAAEDPFTGCAWWRSTLAPLRPRDEELAATEDALLDASQMARALPTALADYKGHPLYALERHVHKFQAIYPREPVLGHCRGEPVFPRANVRDLHSRDAWAKVARVVREGEVPFKVVPSRQRSVDDRVGDDSQRESLLFGEWQTEPYVARPVVDGVVPKNAHGSVELFKRSMLPPGAAHLRQHNIASIARRLGIDHAPALVGFEFRAGRSTPLHDGIVVAQEHAQLLEDAWQHEESGRVERARAKREAEVVARWARLTKALVIRSRLLRRFEGPSTGHEHAYDATSLRVDSGGRWTKTCACGHVTDSDPPPGAEQGAVGAGGEDVRED